MEISLQFVSDQVGPGPADEKNRPPVILRRFLAAAGRLLACGLACSLPAGEGDLSGEHTNYRLL
ncbi:MAG: hypothetical protein DRQ37_04560 [Gammaproteobacteria bacterium]|nr:MAG: hypothetical protein DRQ37_04560 [Gammaproteobacteria bacterium]